MFLSNVKTLVLMQLKNKLDLSRAKDTRSVIIRTLLSVLKIVVITVVMFLVFFLCKFLGIFEGSDIPDTAVGSVFVVVMILATISCTVGLTQTLYYSADNRVLLTLPVSASEIFLSKMVMYYIFELKRNLSLTLPLFVAYGIINGAVWYYYLWLIVCFVFISLLPVLIGAVLSIPALFIVAFVGHYKWTQILLIVLATAGITALLVVIINAIPENIDINGQWQAICRGVRDFLAGFCRVFYPVYCLCLMIVGGTSLISGVLFSGATFVYFGIMIALLLVLVAITYFGAKPLFFKMASKLFEFDKPIVPPQKNKVHSAFWSPYSESLKMTLRRSRELVSLLVELILPGVALLLLNKVYAAMNTNNVGAVMTRAFNILVSLTILLSFNARYAKVYSKEAGARNIIKTRPQSYLNTLFARISLRVVVSILSSVGCAVFYGQVANLPLRQSIMFGIIMTCVTVGHLLWSAELDIVNSQADQYLAVGEDLNNPNENKSTLIALILAVVFSALFYLFTDLGAYVSLVKCAIIATLFLASRIYFYIVRTKLYFREN